MKVNVKNCSSSIPQVVMIVLANIWLTAIDVWVRLVKAEVEISLLVITTSTTVLWTSDLFVIFLSFSAAPLSQQLGSHPLRCNQTQNFAERNLGRVSHLSHQCRLEMIPRQPKQVSHPEVRQYPIDSRSGLSIYGGLIFYHRRAYALRPFHPHPTVLPLLHLQGPQSLHCSEPPTVLANIAKQIPLVLQGI